jgi:hypothetical protein
VVNFAGLPCVSPSVAKIADEPCERDANISPSTRVHARVTPPRQIPSVCGAFVTAKARQCPRVPLLAQDGKEGVDGSSPSEGSAKAPLTGIFRSERLADRASYGGYGAVMELCRSRTFPLKTTICLAELD